MPDMTGRPLKGIIKLEPRVRSLDTPHISNSCQGVSLKKCDINPTFFEATGSYLGYFDPVESILRVVKTWGSTILEITEYNDQLVKNTRNQL